MNRVLHGLQDGKTGHEYMARSGRLRRPGRGLKSEDQSNPKTGSDHRPHSRRFRLIVDD